MRDLLEYVYANLWEYVFIVALSAKLYLPWRDFVIHLVSFLSLRGGLTLLSCPIVLSTYSFTFQSLKQFCESV